MSMHLNCITVTLNVASNFPRPYLPRLNQSRRLYFSLSLWPTQSGLLESDILAGKYKLGWWGHLGGILSVNPRMEMY